ncbi:unnamed protein product, partial [marine sediment metagenome]
LGLPKISDRLAEVARPLLDDAEGEEAERKSIALAAFGWNLAVLPEEEREKELSEIAGKLALDDPADRSILRDILVRMIARKNSLFPDDNRLIASYDLSYRDGNLHLLVASIVSSGRKAVQTDAPQEE